MRAIIRSGIVGFIDWLGELGVRHNSDIGTFVPRVLDDTPAEMRKEIRSAGREEIDGGITARCSLTHDMFREHAPNAVATMGRSNENVGEPGSELWMGVHLMVDKHGRAE
jgi:hypothetical protein